MARHQTKVASKAKIVLLDEKGQRIEHTTHFLFHTTNNAAKY